MTGNLTASSTDGSTAGSSLTCNLTQYNGTAGLSLNGTYSAVIQFEATLDQLNWVAVNAYPASGTQTAVTSATGTTGLWRANVAGMAAVRLRCSTYTSGTAVAVINISQASIGY